jgi:hypothetical protein
MLEKSEGRFLLANVHGPDERFPLANQRPDVR